VHLVGLYTYTLLNICVCVDNQRNAQFLINNFYSTVFSFSTCFERITRSSSVALSSIRYHAVGTIVQADLAASI
jgi:hypothetical protein